MLDIIRNNMAINAMSVLSVASSLVSIVKGSIGILQRGPHVKIDRVWISEVKKEDKKEEKETDKWIVIAILSNHGNQHAKECECVIRIPDAIKEWPLKLPLIETERGAAMSLGKYDLGAGGVIEVRGYVPKSQNGQNVKMLELILKRESIVEDTIAFDLTRI